MKKQSGRRSPDRPAPWPRTRQRERVLGLIRQHGGVVDAATLAEQTDLHVTTVRFHLDALCADGLVARTRINRPGVGRPRTGYVAVEGRMDYRTIVEVLARELGDTVAERQERAQRAGRRWAERFTTETPEAGDTADSQTARIAAVFGQMGFAPEVLPAAGEQATIALHNCPVRELALQFPEVSCGIHRGLLQGLAGSEGRRAELDPFVTPERCVARIVTDD